MADATRDCQSEALSSSVLYLPGPEALLEPWDPTLPLPLLPVPSAPFPPLPDPQLWDQVIPFPPLPEELVTAFEAL